VVRQFLLIGLLVLVLVGCAQAAIATPSLPPAPTPASNTVPITPTAAPPTETRASATLAPTNTQLPTITFTPTAALATVPSATIRVVVTPTSETAGPLEGAALVQALRQGGYTIVFRHAITDRSQTDSVPQVLEDCGKQRNLNEQGRTQAREIGSAITRLKIPIGRVLTSPYCRTRETAMLAFGSAEVTLKLDNAFINADRREELERSLKELVLESPEAGTNTVLVTHGDNMTRALGVSVAEGEAAIVQRDGRGGFMVVEKVTSDEWQALSTE